MPFVGFPFVRLRGQWTNIFSIRNAESAIVQRGQVNVRPEQLKTLLWQTRKRLDLIHLLNGNFLHGICLTSDPEAKVYPEVPNVRETFENYS